MHNYFQNIIKHRHILFALVRRDLLSKYRHSILGIAWTLVTPLSMVAVIGVVYSVLFNTAMVEFIPFLFSGLAPWMFLSSSIDSGAHAFIIAEGYITQTRTNIEIFPLRIVVSSFVNYFFMVISFFIIFAFINISSFSLYMFLVIPASIIMFIFVLGIVNFVSIINLYIRDYSYVQSIIMQALFYATPLIYPVDIIKERGMEYIYVYNPLYYFLDIIRQSLLGNNELNFNNWIVAILLSTVVFLTSVLLLNKIGRKIVFKF